MTTFYSCLWKLYYRFFLTKHACFHYCHHNDLAFSVLQWTLFIFYYRFYGSNYQGALLLLLLLLFSFNQSLLLIIIIHGLLHVLLLHSGCVWIETAALSGRFSSTFLADFEYFSSYFSLLFDCRDTHRLLNIPGFIDAMFIFSSLDFIILN